VAPGAERTGQMAHCLPVVLDQADDFGLLIDQGADAGDSAMFLSQGVENARRIGGRATWGWVRLIHDSTALLPIIVPSRTEADSCEGYVQPCRQRRG